MALLDVNALVALAWDSHVHHLVMRRWFDRHGADGWSTCPVTESGFVRVSTNPRVLPEAVSSADAITVLSAIRAQGRHRFRTDDVSVTAVDFPALRGYRQVTDAHLVVLARRHGEPLVTFDRALPAIHGAEDVELLTMF